MSQPDESTRGLSHFCLRHLIVAAAALVFAGWFLGRYQSLRVIESLEAELEKTESLQDTTERHLATLAKSGDKITDYPYAYAFADQHLTEGDEHFIAAYQYATRDDEAMPPKGCEILWYDFVNTKAPMEGEAGDCFLIVVDGVICKTGHGETLQY